MVLLCLLLVLAALAVSLAATAVLVRSGGRWGGLDLPGSELHKQHQHAVPNTGGIAIVLALALPIVVALVAVWVIPASGWSGPFTALGPHVAGLRSQTVMAVGVLTVMAALHVLGRVDDRRRLSPRLKLAVELLLAALLALFFDMRILEFLVRFGPLGLVACLLASVLWIVVIINAMNMLDNMDGLSAGVGAIIAALYLAATLLNGQWFVAALSAVLLGALVGFLVFNFPPARIFMGDGGSLVLGLLLAVISIRTTYYDPDALTQTTQPAPGVWYGLLMPLLVLAIPLYDLVSVTLLRLRSGRSVMVGDQNHFSHRLVRRGLSRQSAVLVIWLATAATGLGGVMLGRLVGWQAAIVAAQAVAVLIILALLERGR